MKWSDKFPVPVPAAWNMLCDASKERIAYFGAVVDQSSIQYFPDIPCLRQNPRTIAGLIPDFRLMLCSLYHASFDLAQLDKWCTLSIPEQLYKPDDPRFEKWGIDGYAFFMQPDHLPRRRHAVSDFIRAASLLLNDVIRYPRPVFADAGDQNGFFIDADLEAEEFESGNHLSGSVAENWSLSNGVVSQRGDYLANWYYKDWRGRSFNHRWFYRPGYISGIGIPKYKLPVLKNTGGIRSTVTVQKADDHAGSGREEIDCGRMEFTMDFSTGLAADAITFPEEVRDLASGIWEFPLDDPEWNSRYVRFDQEKAEVLLSAENFPELPYIYLE